MTNRSASPIFAMLALALAGPGLLARGQVFADFETTRGKFSIELFHADAPRTVANFVSLAEGTRPWLDPRTQKVRVGVPYYDGIIFHRVIPNFMIQGGSPQGNGRDGPGYKFPDEFTKSPDGQLRRTHNAAGRMSMANSGAHTNGSQFFITTSVTPPATFPTHLNDKHTVFGQIADGPGVTAAQGQAVVDSIAAVPRTSADRPEVDVVIQAVRIRRVGDEAAAFDPLAWALPDVTQARTFTEALLVPGVSPPATTRFELDYERRRHEATVFSYSFDGADWRLLQVGGAASTVIAGSDGIDPLNINNVGPIPSLFVRGHVIDYAPLIARTKPALSETAEMRFSFTSPTGMVLHLHRTGPASGTWSRPSPPSASGPVSTVTYAFGAGDAGFFSPTLTLGFGANPLPWTGGAELSNLNITLNFNATDPAAGYFYGTAVNAANGSLSPISGAFTVAQP